MRFVLLTALLIASQAAGAATKDSCDRSCLVEKAMQGDGPSAIRLADLSLKESTNFKRNHDRMVYWYRVAAENGSRLGQWNYAQFLVGDSRSRSDCVRALFWFKRAQLQGEPLAKDAVLSLTQSLSDENAFQTGCIGAL